MSLAAGAGLSTALDPIAATEAACDEALGALRGSPVDLALVFFSSGYGDAAMDVAATALKRLEPRVLLGASAEAVVGGSREIEDRPAVSAWAGSFPGVSLLPFGMEFMPTDEGGVLVGFPSDVPPGATVLLLADPFTFPAGELLRRLNDDRRGVRIVGGMASGGTAAGRSRLILDAEVRNGGAVGAVIAGPVSVVPLVSQGCRPIGSPATVTQAEANVIVELGGRPPVERIRETFAAATPEERVAMQRGLHIGRVIDEYKEEFRRGDFLIRGVTGADAQTGAITVGDRIDVGETVQFHIRDAASADEDLRELLAGAPAGPGGALLFTCNGRGSNLFAEPDHDAQAVQQGLGGVPLAGFFCAGELGPVGGKNFLHGFTASMAIFYDG